MSETNFGSKQKIEVSLMGQKFTVRSDRDEAYLATLSKMVNAHMEDIKVSTKMASPQSLALLAALNIADQLARTKEALSLVEERLFFEKKEFEELKEELLKRTQTTLQEVETALSFLPENRYESENFRHESGPSGTNADSIAKD